MNDPAAASSPVRRRHSPGVAAPAVRNDLSTKEPAGRSGGTYTGEAGTDGTTWTMIGTATSGGAAAAQDVGVFMTAANGWTGTRGIADFRNFTVS